MDQPIFDEKTHILSDEEGYIAKKIVKNRPESNLNIDIEGLIDGYSKYIYENDKSTVMGCLKEMLRKELLTWTVPHHRYQVIYRPPYMSGPFSEFGTLIIKFKRAPKDNL